MSWLAISNLVKHGVWIGIFLVLLTTMSAAPPSRAQAMQKGISVVLAPTSGAVPVPDADNQDV